MLQQHQHVSSLHFFAFIYLFYMFKWEEIEIVMGYFNFHFYLSRAFEPSSVHFQLLAAHHVRYTYLLLFTMDIQFF